MVVNMCIFYGNGRQNRLLLITKCMRAEIKRDEKLLIDLEGWALQKLITHSF